MSKQAAFDLAQSATYKREDFFVAPCNALASAQIERWPDWPSHFYLLQGGKGAGKTHLLHIWTQKAGALYCKAAALSEEMIKENINHFALDDVDEVIGDRAKEELLFHLYQHARTHKKSILASLAQNISAYEFVLKDLESRLLKENSLVIDVPDENLLALMMLKLFRDRQMIVTDDVIFYALTRLPRSFDAVHRCVTEVDRLAFERVSPITKNLMKEVIAKME